MRNRVLEPTNYMDDSSRESIILPQTIGRSLSMKPVIGEKRRDRDYYTSETFWHDILSERVGAERAVVLHAMRLFEWFPRNPGLFYTNKARSAREIAQYHIRGIDQRVYDAFQANADAPPDHATLIRSMTDATGPARRKIYTPYGKMSMLQGGIGCIRLQPVRLEDGERAWFMSATSGVAPDEGIPLLVPDPLYQDVIDHIRGVGFATMTIRGRIRFIPKRFLDLYAAKNRIPRLYVEVEDLADSGPDQEYGLVSVAASFIAEVDGRASIYAAYVTFDPGQVGARDSATKWMQEEYVRGFYEGEVLTDFDQQAPAFSDTLFSLNDVLTSPDLAALILRLKQSYGHFDWEMLENRAINFNQHTENVRMKVEANNNSGNMVVGGDHSHNQLVINNADLNRLTQDLARLVTEVRGEPPSDDRDRAVGALLDAKEAASEGNGDGATSALRRLKPLAKKIIDIGEKVGVGLAVAAIKSAIGF
jgi:hypothetical protein